MLMRICKILSSIVVWFVVLSGCIQGQSIVSMTMPNTICYGDTVYVTMGESTDDNIIITYPEVSLGHADTLFLPDGVECGSLGCSYVSSVLFEGYEEGATVTSGQTVKYLRINIEHSYVGDLFIRVRCPNNQDAVVLRFGGAPTSDCVQSIPATAMGWLTGANVSTGSKLGSYMASIDGSHPCDPDRPLNAPGTGWNYCWSNNTTSGYSYASGDGIFYRNGHSTNNIMDSSDVEQRSNFYHPDEDFSSLVGCPLNGEWSVEVMDGWGGDNGYIFGWEIALDASLLPGRSCVYNNFSASGRGVTQVDSNRFMLYMPAAGRQHDTTVCYRFEARDTCGRVLDTVACVTYRASRHTTVNRECVENQLPYRYLSYLFADSVTDSLLHFVDYKGCDSIVHFNLWVWRNSTTELDTTICDGRFPLEWHGLTFDTMETHAVTLQDSHGADSTLVCTVGMESRDTTVVFARVCNGAPYRWIDGVTYYEETDEPCYTIVTDGICDSVLRLHLLNSDNPYMAKIDAVPNPVTADNLTVTLTDHSNSVYRSWNYLGNIDTARHTTFVYPFENDSVMVLFSAADAFGCKDTASVTVYKDMALIWAPTAFTPDEQSNRFFAIVSNGVMEGTVTVYTRSGLLVTSFDLLTGSWDGRWNGSLCPQGSYVWHLTYRGERNANNVREVRGIVTLLR